MLEWLTNDIDLSPNSSRDMGASSARTSETIRIRLLFEFAQNSIKLYIADILT